MNRAQFWVTTGIAAAALVLVMVNAVLFSGNRALQVEINRRGQFIQQSLQLEGLFNEIVRALAELSARSNDEQLKALLQSVGITFAVNPPALPAPKK